MSARAGRLARLAVARLRGVPGPGTLVARGLELGEDVHIGPDCNLDPSHCWLISIGDRAVLGPRVHVLAHDASTKAALGYTTIARVRIGSDVFLGAGSIVLPGVTVGDGAIVGAGSVVTRDVPERTLVAGNPAEIQGPVEPYLDRRRAGLEAGPRYPYAGWTLGGGIDDERKRRMRDELRDRPGYVE